MRKSVSFGRRQGERLAGFFPPFDEEQVADVFDCLVKEGIGAEVYQTDDQPRLTVVKLDTGGLSADTADKLIKIAAGAIVSSFGITDTGGRPLSTILADVPLLGPREWMLCKKRRMKPLYLRKRGSHVG